MKEWNFIIKKKMKMEQLEDYKQQNGLKLQEEEFIELFIKFSKKLIQYINQKIYGEHSDIISLIETINEGYPKLITMELEQLEI